MRTTLTLDQDVAALVARAQRMRQTSLKAVINEGLRQGLKEVVASPPRRRRFITRSVYLGRCRMDNLDDVAEVLALAEGENFR